MTRYEKNNINNLKVGDLVKTVTLLWWWERNGDEPDWVYIPLRYRLDSPPIGAIGKIVEVKGRRKITGERIYLIEFVINRTERKYYAVSPDCFVPWKRMSLS